MKTLLPFKSLHLCAIFFLSMLLGSSLSQAQCTSSFISVPDTSGTGVSFTSTSTGTSGSTQYYWSFGDGSTGTGANPYHVYNSTGWFAVCLLITDTNCQSSTCDSVFVGSVVNFCQASFTSQVGGLTASFTENSVGTMLNFQWDFGDGSTSTGQNATHTYALPGQYLVCLIIWNLTCSDTTCNYITVTSGGNCSASFFSIDSAGVTYFSATSQGTGFPTYTWDFGDGSFGTGQFPMHTYNSIMSYYACLTVTYYDTNQTMLCTATYCDSVLSNGGGCQASWNWTAGTAAGEIDFTDLSTTSDSIVSWFWDFGDNSTSTLQNPSHIFSQTGNYYVCLTITATDQNGSITCTNTYCSYILVQNGGGCQASFAYYDSLGHISFVNTSTGINFVTAQYYWDFGDGFTSTDVNPFHTYNGPGPYYVCLTISDSAAGCYSTFCDSVYIGLNTGCQASFKVVADTTGFGFSFYNTSIGTNNTTTYLWTSSDGFTGTGTSFQHIYTAQGWYQVCLTINVYDSLQNLICNSTACDSLYAGTGGGTQCNANWGYQVSNFDAFFADLSTGNDTVISWLWDFGDGSTSSLQNPVHTYLQSGYYYVCLMIETAANGVITCSDIFCQLIYAGLNNTGCQANFSMYPDSAGTGFQFQNISTGTTGATNYYWDFGDNNSSTQENPFHTYSTTGWFMVCLTISDSAANCTSTVCDSINVGGSVFCDAYFNWNGDTTNGVQFYQFNNNLPNVWTFVDGDSSSLADPYHAYAAAGVYNACLTVWQLDSLGSIICSSSYCDSVYTGLNAGCGPQINASPDSNSWGNGNMNFSVYSACGNINSVTWDFGDGTTGTGMNPSHQYSSTGWYHVCVDVEINGTIYTECDSIFAFRLVGVEEMTSLIISGLYPNPASTYINISYALNKSAQVSVSLFDLAGRKVKMISDGRKNSGLHIEVVDLQDISMGSYLLQLSTDGSVTTRRIIVNR